MSHCSDLRPSGLEEDTATRLSLRYLHHLFPREHANMLQIDARGSYSVQNTEIYESVFAMWKSLLQARQQFVNIAV
jgi:hypothetical protein